MAARRTGKLAYAREMVELIAARHPDRRVHMVGDAAYVGEHLRGLDTQLTWTSRLKVTSVLHGTTATTPPRTGRSGRPRTKGARLSTPTDLAATATTSADFLLTLPTEARRHNQGTEPLT